MLSRITDYVKPTPTEGMGLTVIHRRSWLPLELERRIDAFDPRTEFGRIVKTCFQYLPAEAAGELLEGISRIVVLESALSVKRIEQYNPYGPGPLVTDLGVVSRHVITTTGVQMLVDVFQSSAAGLTFYYHALGLSTAAEAVSDVALGNEMTTAGYGSAARSSGTLTTGASAAVFETVGSVTVDSVTSGTPMVIQEHGIFKSSAVASTGLWDRSLTGTQTLSTGDALTVTYDMTASAGG